jgi:voltage-gated potassium channel
VIRQQKRRKVFHRLSQRLAESAITGTGLVIILALTFGSLLILQVERQNPDANIRTSADALWWSFVTMSTVGYGDHFPVTHEGRLMAILLMTVGIGLFGVLTSYLATTFMAPYQKDKEPTDDIMSLKDDMAALQTKLEAIERLLKDS